MKIPKEGLNVFSAFDGASMGQQALKELKIPINKYFASEIDKHAIKVAMDNHPNTIQIGDVTKVRGIDLPKIDLFIGGSPCFVGNTPILCRTCSKEIKDISVGDYVLTHTGKYQKVLKVGGQIKDIYSLHSQGAVPTFTTENHPYYIRKRFRKWNSEKRKYEFLFKKPEWIRVKYLKKGDFVGTPILQSSKNDLGLTKEECFLLGVYLGDGHTRKDYKTSEGRPKIDWQLIISVGSHEKDLFVENVKIKHNLYPHTQSTYRVVFSSKRLVEIAEKYLGSGSENKYISKTILDLPNDLLKSFIDGYELSKVSCRGNIYRATTVSENLVRTMALAVAKVYKTTCSIEHTKRPNKTIIQDRIVNQRNTWIISYRKEHPKQSRAWVIDNIIWNPIKSIIKQNEKTPVYNIEVEEDNSYVANNHIVHNCQGFSFSGKQLNFNDPRSKLFFDFVRLKNELNPKYWLLENVFMKQEYQDVISKHLGVEPVKLNSCLTSAQNRVRLYWSNFDITEPSDRFIKLEDIVEDNQMIGPSAIRGRRLNKASILGRRLDERGKRQDYDKKIPITQCLEVRKTNTDKSNCLTTVAKDTVLTIMPVGRHPNAFDMKDKWRNYTKIERCRLMNLPDYYCDSVSLNQAVKITGNGWEVGMIKHIFNCMFM